jgi:hypothetical protein
MSGLFDLSRVNKYSWTDARTPGYTGDGEDPILFMQVRLE